MALLWCKAELNADWKYEESLKVLLIVRGVVSIVVDLYLDVDSTANSSILFNQQNNVNIAQKFIHNNDKQKLEQPKIFVIFFCTSVYWKVIEKFTYLYAVFLLRQTKIFSYMEIGIRLLTFGISLKPLRSYVIINKIIITVITGYYAFHFYSYAILRISSHQQGSCPFTIYI